MKKSLPLLAIVLLSFIAYFALKPTPTDSKPDVKLPWDITTHADGRSEVFGLTLEQTTLAETLQLLGEDHELAVIANQDNYSALEVYYSHFASGPLKGKLIIVIDAPQQALMEIQDNPAASTYMASGARRFSLSPQDLDRAQLWPIKSLSFIPATNLEAEIFQKRFGTPADIVAESETTQHLLYPQLGLDIVVNAEAKEQLIYVAPRAFQTLQTPLQELINKTVTDNTVTP